MKYIIGFAEGSSAVILLLGFYNHFQGNSAACIAAIIPLAISVFMNFELEQ